MPRCHETYSDFFLFSIQNEWQIILNSINLKLTMYVMVLIFILSKVSLRLRLPYLPVYNAHFFPKLTSKFAVRIIHGTYCLVMFSLAYLHTYIWSCNFDINRVFCMMKCMHQYKQKEMKIFWLWCKNKFLSSVPYLNLLKSRFRLRNTIMHNALGKYSLCGPMC